jgi:hypothetical protein
MTTTAKTSKLTIYSQYHNDRRETYSRNPQYLRRLCNQIRRGDGDWIKIEDEDGITYDLIDLGRGVELR